MALATLDLRVGRLWPGGRLTQRGAVRLSLALRQRTRADRDRAPLFLQGGRRTDNGTVFCLQGATAQRFLETGEIVTDLSRLIYPSRCSMLPWLWRSLQTPVYHPALFTAAAILRSEFSDAYRSGPATAPLQRAGPGQLRHTEPSAPRAGSHSAPAAQLTTCKSAMNLYRRPGAAFV